MGLSEPKNLMADLADHHFFPSKLRQIGDQIRLIFGKPTCYGVKARHACLLIDTFPHPQKCLQLLVTLGAPMHRFALGFTTL
jgi:hypothetical protein